MKEKISIQREYQVSFILTISITLLLFVACISQSITNTYELAQKIVVPDIMEMLSFIGIYTLPVLGLMSWYLCVKNYLQLEADRAGNQHDEKKENDLADAMIAITCLGIGVIYHILCIMTNCIMYWKVLDRIYPYVVIELAIAGCWIIGLFFAMGKRKKEIDRKWKVLGIIIVLFMVIVSYESATRIDGTVEQIWEEIQDEKMDEYRDRYPGKMVPTPYPN